MIATTLPPVSVIIPAYKAPQSLNRLLKILETQGHTDPGDLEVIVVNDGSHDSSYEAIANVSGAWPFSFVYYPVLRRCDDAPNVQAVINFAVNMSHHPLLIIMDDKLVIDSHTIFLHRLIHGLQNDSKLLVFPYECNDGDEHCPQADYEFRLATGRLVDVWVTFGGNSLWRAAWDDLGGLELDYSGGVGADDRDFAVRAYQAGYRILQMPGITRINSDAETGGSFTAQLSSTLGEQNENLFLERFPEYAGHHWGVI
jgi:glycosyltransferase involved in cell wall biosynthesis